MVLAGVFMSSGLVWFYAGVHVLRFGMVLRWCSRAQVWYDSTLLLTCSGLVWLYAGVHVLRFGMVLHWCSPAQVWYGSTLVFRGSGLVWFYAGSCCTYFPQQFLFPK